MTDEKLDRSKTFGTVYGDPNVGYEQGGQQFKHDGTLHVPTQAGLTGPGVTDATPRSVDGAVKTALGLKSQFRRSNEPAPGA